MTTRTIDCPDCGAAVPRGRLSCRDCGALLVAVTGNRSAAIEAPTATSEASEPAEDTLVETWAETVAHAISVPRSRSVPTAAVPPPIVVESGLDASPAEPPSSSVTEPDPAPEAAPEPEVVLAPEPVAPGQLTMAVAPEPEPVQAYLLPDPPDIAPSIWPPAPRMTTAAAAAAAYEPAAYEPDEPLDSDQDTGTFPDWVNEPILEPRPYAGGATRTTTNTRTAGNALATPAAYRPPTMTMAAAGSASAAAGPWPGTSAPEASPPEQASRKTWSPPAIALDPARATELATWFVIVGATLGLLGFLLPWSRVVIGSGVYGDYFASWGLAGPRHVFVVLGLMAMLALAVLQTRVPAWVSSGVLGLIGGSLLIGMVWPYLIGPLGADVGVLVTALGGVALIGGGILAVWSSHHVEAAPAV